MEGTLRCTLGSQAQHAHTRSIQQSTSTHTKHIHNIQQQNSNNKSGGSGMSEVYMLKSMGERMPPFGTPDLNWRFVDEWFLNVVYAMRPLM